MDGPIVICRSATHFLRLGYVKGYQCRRCGAELQVSPVGVDQIAAGGIPACHPCAGALLAALQAAGGTAVENPGAREQREECEKARRRRNAV